ncbi:MAG: aspartate dehydrogenase [Oscillospiraceae bacterium]|nr:aspartate dehydrogenase [Oscillospiraceae bacterium]
MSLFRREKKPAYDPEKLQPAVRKSYCNREMAVGFIDKATGKFREFGCATSQRELEEFCAKLGINPNDLKVFY